MRKPFAHRATPALLAIAVVLFTTAAAAEFPKWVRLSWSDPDAATTMAVTWNSDTGAGPSQVQYGETPTLGQEATGTSFKANGELGYVHEVELWDLKPDTAYWYRAGSPSSWGNVYTFHTGPLPGCRPIHFVALGDGRSQDESGPALQWPDIFADSLGEEPDLVINTGDIVKDGAETKQWAKWLQETAPLLPQVVHMTSLGNHDDDKDDGDLASYNQIFQLPRNAETETEDFYWFRYGDAIFVSLSTATYGQGTKPYEVQAQWLDEVLTANQATWKFVFFHHPPYTSHAEAFGLEFNHPPNELGQNAAFVPVFDKHHVDVVFAGHNHFYERFAPMKGGGGNPTSNPVSDPSQGTIYVITGGAGAFTYDKIDLGFVTIDPMQDLVCAGPNQAPGSIVCSGKHHYVTVSIDGGKMTADVIATAAQNFTNDPGNIEIIDTFSITKAAPTASGCGEEPGPIDGPDGGATDTSDGGSTDDADAGSTEDAGGDPDEDADDHADSTGERKQDVTSPPIASDTLEGSGDGQSLGGGGGPVLDDANAPGGGGGGTNGEGKTPGATPDEQPGGGGISPVPTPNVGGSGSGATTGGCATTSGHGAPLWFALALLGLLGLRRSRLLRRTLPLLALGALPSVLDGCSRAEAPPEQKAPETRRRPAEPEGLTAGEEPPTAPAATAQAPEAPPEEPALPGEQVRLPTLGGFDLAASWLRADAPTAPIVVLLHRMESDRAEWAPLMTSIRDSVGASVLAVDLRGHGESTQREAGSVRYGDMKSDDWAALPADVRAAVTWARQQVEDPARTVALVGADVGGSAAMLCAADDPRIVAIAVLSPGLSYHGLEPLPSAQRLASRKLLLVAGADDKYAVHSAKVLAEAAPGSEVRVVDGTTAHGVALLTAGAGAVGPLQDWLAGALRAP